MEFNKVVESRRSIHKFVPGEIDREDLVDIVKAGMQAPNMANRRPWEFYIVTDHAILEEIVMAHKPGKNWKEASALIVICARKDYQAPLPEDFMWLDCAASLSYMLLAAADKNYGSCWVGMYPDEEKSESAKKLLHCEGTPFGAMVVGTSGEEPKIRDFFEEEKIHFI